MDHMKKTIPFLNIPIAAVVEERAVLVSFSLL